MEYSIIQIALVFVVTFIAAIDQFDFLESLYQPIGHRRRHRSYPWRP